jgi:hypothetical protein
MAQVALIDEKGTLKATNNQNIACADCLKMDGLHY